MPKKLKGGPFGEIFFRKRSLYNAEKIERGTLWDFSTSILSQNSKKMKVGPFGENFPKKSRSAEKTERGSRPVLYVTRETFLVQFPGPIGKT